jgi:hypothetical protein
MKVLIDGIEVKCENEVKVIYEDEIIGFDKKLGGRGIEGELHVTLTDEGMFADTFEKNAGTTFISTSMWKSLNDIIAETH